MASSEENFKRFICNDFTKFPICFEDFKMSSVFPFFLSRVLEESHPVCCHSKEASVGFFCPLCRDFIPAANISAELKDWAN